MALHCCVPNCTNDSRYDSGKQLSFHCFPADESLRKQWVVKIRRDIGPNFQVTKGTRVCSQHFRAEDMIKTLAGLRKLKPGTVPTQFDWSKAVTRRAPKKRVPCSVTVEPVNGRDTECCEVDDDEVTETPCVSEDHDYNCKPRSDREHLEGAVKRIEELAAENAMLRQQMFGLERFSSDSANIRFFTGFKNYETLKAVYLALEPTAQRMLRWTQVQRQSGNANGLKYTVFRSESLKLIDQFFLFLCRIRQGLFEQDLAVRFNVSQSTVSRTLITWVNYLYFMLGSLPIWCSRAKIDANMPPCFRDTYPKTRVILDCTEIKVQTPSSKVLNSKTYSSYKSHTTFKSLLGISPFGSPTFVSPLYTGCISDKEITKLSGIVGLVEAGDDVMADKGFLISDLLSAKNATLNIPPFLGEKGKFSRKEVIETQEIARVRIHVERAIRRVKEYHILDGVLPLSLAGSANQLWTVCVLLTIFKGPLF